ncbi:hypothetical protein U9M48_037852 [Paspalum notatum var. saurae]|uniref:Uncharacterized protein n=1 Tax=Paspalum notatum var. saurae TaxID=547442 RepID=A0AAQ3UM51_PASNO
MEAFQSATPVAADVTINVAITGDAADEEASGIIVADATVQEKLGRAAEKLEADFSKMEAKMHRYPASFRGLRSKDDSYFVPQYVAIGPYHHGAAHLQRAEEMKRAAACFLCEDWGHPAEEVYAKILSVADDARSCYDDDLQQLQDAADFATMMFHDGCFLLHYIIHRTGRPARPSLACWFVVNQESILWDMFLLENQVPWLVLDSLMAFVPAPVGQFIANVVATSFEASWQGVGRDKSSFSWNKESGYKPAHLLDLLRYYQSGDRKSRGALTIPGTDVIPGIGITSVPQSSSAIDLAEIGVQLTSNRTAKFRDMGVRKGIFFCKLFLAPLVMDDTNARMLLNMLALEVSSRATYEDSPVRSYILLIAMLMNREEDVHQLRAKHILHGRFSDQRTLSFVKGLVDLSFDTNRHRLLLAELEAYRHKRWIWISLYKFVYNNQKSIVTVFSIIGVLVPIFKALFSIKQHQQ